MATVVRENIGLLHDKLIVKVSKDDYYNTFDKKVKEYSKTANIPGFRKGMVPVGMIKKMYGISLYNDEVIKTVEKELFNYLNTEKPEIFAQPLPLATDLPKMDFNNPTEYEFAFEIGLKPAFTLANLKNATTTLYKVNTTDIMVDEELNRMQIKGGKMTEPEEVATPEDVLNILFIESDKDGVVKEGGIKKENSVILKYLSASTQNSFIGKKNGDIVTVQLKNAFETDKLAAILSDLGYATTDGEAANNFFNLKIEKIGLVEKRVLDETFFKEIYPEKNIQSEQELREAIKEEIQLFWDAQSKNQLHDQLYHYLLDETKMEFPNDFLIRWLQSDSEKPKTIEEAATQFPAFSNQLKWTLISDTLIKENNLEVANDELRESMKIEIMNYFGGMTLGDDTSWIESYVDRMMKDEKQVDNRYRKLITDKLFNYLQTQIQPTEKIVTSEVLEEMIHNHKH